MKIKYVDYTMTEKKGEFVPWNRMTFYDCEVKNIKADKYSSGKRMCIEIEAPRIKRKYFLYAWSDDGIEEAIEKSGLKKGDLISCYTELTYYKKDDGRHYEAFKIVANDAYDSKVPENERYFKFMVIKRDVKEKKQTSGSCLSKEDILMKMLG